MIWCNTRRMLHFAATSYSLLCWYWAGYGSNLAGGISESAVLVLMWHVDFTCMFGIIWGAFWWERISEKFWISLPFLKGQHFYSVCPLPIHLVWLLNVHCTHALVGRYDHVDSFLNVLYLCTGLSPVAFLSKLIFHLGSSPSFSGFVLHIYSWPMALIFTIRASCGTADMKEIMLSHKTCTSH